jgi:hypothetical protein
VDQALNKIDEVLMEDNAGNRNAILQLMQAIVGHAAPDFLGALIPDEVNDILKQLDPTLDQLKSVAGTLRQAVGDARQALEQSGQFTQELVNTLTSQAAAIDGVVNKAKTDILDILKQFDLGSQDSPFVHYTDQQLTDLIMQKIEDRFFGSVVASELRRSSAPPLRSDASIRQTTDSVSSK